MESTLAGTWVSFFVYLSVVKWPYREYIPRMETSPSYDEGLWNFGLYSAPKIFEQRGIFIVPSLLWHEDSVLRSHSQELSQLRTNKTSVQLSIYSNMDLHGTVIGIMRNSLSLSLSLFPLSLFPLSLSLSLSLSRWKLIWREIYYQTRIFLILQN